MNRTQKKLEFIKIMPHCAECGCVLKISPFPNGHDTNEAVLNGRVLICYQCHRMNVKREEIARLPLLKRWKKKIDIATGFFGMLRKLKIFCNQYYYFKIKKGKPTTRLPAWIKK